MVVWHFCIIITSTIFLVLCNQRFVQIHENFVVVFFAAAHQQQHTHIQMDFLERANDACSACSTPLVLARLLCRRHVHNIALLNISAYAHIHMYIYLHICHICYIYICICVSVYSMCR